MVAEVTVTLALPLAVSALEQLELTWSGAALD
jgi:hypothetical protein